MKNKTVVTAALALAGLVTIATAVALTLFIVQTRMGHLPYTGPTTFWHDQCIDTMKTSRDKAREWGKRADLRHLIDAQTELVTATGANCIAIGTPYDAEFYPVLEAWVASARTHNLRIWFRGSFAAWEGWFDRPRDMSTEQLLTTTRSFILNHPDLFADGDIFTPAPEAENGAPFKPARTDFATDYRRFIIAESTTASEAFATIGKQVRTNWSSMSGGVARGTLDQATIDRLGGLVTIDHYVKTAPEMGAEIDHYHHTFGAQVVVGEWGAPIPDINGPLTTREQTELVTALLAQLATRSHIVEGVNYWTLTGGSTGLIDDNFTKQPVYDTLTRYYRPTILRGTIRNQRGRAVAGATITLDHYLTATTDKRGNYVMLSPSGRTAITVKASGYAPSHTTIDLGAGRTAAFSTIISR